MRRIDSSFSLAGLAVLLLAFSACSKSADNAGASGKAPDSSKAAPTKGANTKAGDAKTADTKTGDAKAPATAQAPAPGAAPNTKTAAAPPLPAPKPAAPTAQHITVTGGKIDPGMTKAQVIALLGKPASDRTRGEFTYLLFQNGIEKQVGMSDLVVLQGDKVVDAVLRAPSRSFSGTSSSPRAIPADEAKKKPIPPKGGVATP